MNWSKFFAMGGYALYVWGSYGVALIAMGGEVILLRRRKKALAEQGNRSAAISQGDL